MANVLDENVVILKFDNSDFQKNTQDSISSLDKLKASLDKSGSGESLKGLGKAAKSFNLDNMSNAVDKVNKRFSLFGIAGMATINRLTNSAITATKNMVTAIPRQIMQGGWQRALNIENAKFMIEGLEHSWEDTWDKAGNKVEGVKKSVLAAVNQTRYGLDEAAGIAGQLLASNVKNGEELTSALQSISGLASVTNSQYSDIGRIYAQVAGQGRLMGDQLLQISSRGINAAAAIQEYLNKNAKIKDEALAAAIATGKQTTKMKELSQQATLSEGDVRDMVSAGAISFDVFSKSMAGFWDQAQRANETYEGSLANVNASLSRMGAKFESFKLEALKNIFNTLLPILSRVEDLLDPIAEKFGKVSEAATDFLRESVLNPIGKALGAENLFHGFGKEAEKAGKQTKKANDKVGKSTKDLGNKLKVTTKEWKAALDIWNKGTYGTGQKRADAIRKLGMSYENVQGIINKFYESGKDWSKVEHTIIDENQKNEKSTKDLGESAEKAAPQLSALGMVAKGVANTITIFKNAFTGFKNILTLTGRIIKFSFTGPFKLFSGGILKVSDSLVSVTDKFAKFTAKLKELNKPDLFLSLPTWLQRFIAILQTLARTAVDAFNTLGSTVKTFFQELNASEGFAQLKQGLSDIADGILEITQGKLNDVINFFKELGKVGGRTNGLDNAVNFFSGVAGNIGTFLSQIKSGKNPLKDFTAGFEKFKENLSLKHQVKSSLATSVSDVINFPSLQASINNVKKLDIGGVLKSATDAISHFVGEADVINKIKNINLGDTFKSMFGGVKDADWDKISKIAFRLTGMVAILRTMQDMRTLTKSAAKTLGSISGFFSSLSDISQAVRQRIQLDSFKTMAVAIAILVGAVVSMSLIPADRLKPALAGITAMLGVMTGIVALMSSEKFDAKRLTSIGIAFAGMGAAVFLFAQGMRSLAKLKPGEILKAGLAIMAFMGMMLLISKNSKQMVGSGAAFIGMAIAVNLLATAVLAFAMMSFAVLVKGGASILAMVISLSLAAKIAKSSHPGGFVGLAVALNLLIPPIMILAMMPWSMILKGGVAVTGLVIALAAASRIAGASSMKGLASISVAIMPLTASLVVLSFIDTKKLIAAGSALVGTISSIALASKLSQKSIPGMLSMSLLVATIAASIALLIKLDVDKAIAVAAGLSTLMLSISAAVALMSTIGIAKGAKGALGIGLVIAMLVGEVILIAKALEKLDEAFKVSKALDTAIPILEKVGAAIGTFFGTIVGSFLGSTTSGLSKMATDLNEFIDILAPFFKTLKGIDPASITALKDIAKGFSDLASADLKSAIADFLGGFGGSPAGAFKSQLSDFADAFVVFGKKVDKIPDDAVAKSALVAGVFKIFASGEKSLSRQGGWLQGFIGSKDIGKFGKDMADAVSAVAEILKTIKDEKISKNDAKLIKPVMDIINAFAGVELKASGGVLQFFTGNTTIGEFGKQLKKFIENFNEFLPQLKEVDFGDDILGKGGKLAKVISVISIFSETTSEIPPTDGYKQLIVGFSDLPTFMDTLLEFVPKFKEFMTNVADLDVASLEEAAPKVRPIAEMVTTLANAAESLPEAGGAKQVIFGGQDLGLFAEQLSTFSTYLGDFLMNLDMLEISEGSTEKIGKLAGIVKQMATVAEAVPEDTSIFTRWINLKRVELDAGVVTTIAKTANAVNKNIKEDSSSKFKTLAEIVKQMATVAEAVPDDESIWDKLKTLVKVKIDNKTIGEIAKTVQNVSEKTEGIKTENVTNFSKAVSAIGAVAGDMKSLKGIPTGKNLPTLADNVKEFAEKMGDVNVKGIKSKASAVKSAASSLAKAASSSVKINTSGASKSASDLGNAMAKGISGQASAVKKAAKSLVSAANSGVKGDTSSFKTVGKNCAEGFAQGIRNGKYLASGAGSEIGRAALSAAKAAVKTGSPSKEFMKIGRFSSEGFAIGILQLKGRVEESGYEMAKASLDGANSAWSMIDDLSAPVITPVMDLTNVRHGAQSIDSMLSADRALDVNSVVAANLSATYERSRAMDRLVDMMGKPRGMVSEPTTNNFNFNVDGTENPEAFAERLMRGLEIRTRSS